jgi:D-xylose transport system substrate-binding protein
VLRRTLAIAAACLLVSALVAGCGSSNESGAGDDESERPRVGVILPDTKSSQRWTESEPKFFKRAFDRAGVPVEIRNAQGDPAAFQRIGDEMINSGVRILIITNVDSDSGKVVLDRARAEGIPTIDYERLTLSGGADYYVSFDNNAIGETLGYGLTKCVTAAKVVRPVVAELNGSPTDSLATMYKEGYDRVLQPQFDSSTYIKGPDQFVPNWDGREAEQIFTQMLEQQPKIRAVLAANDDLAAAVLRVLKAKGLTGRIPVTGQDATVAGLRNVLAGDQCMTIYKKIELEAGTAANLAVKLFKGEKPKVGGEVQDPQSGRYVPFASLPPMTIEAAQVKEVVADGFVSRAELCVGRYAALCDRYGV